MQLGNDSDQMSSTTFSLTKMMTVDQIDWESVANYLVRSGKLSPGEARREISRLLEPYVALYELSWFASQKPDSALHSVISALCQVHSIDGIILKKEEKVSLLGIPCIRYAETLNMVPSSGSVEDPSGDERIIPTVFIGIGKKEYSISRWSDVGLIRGGIILLGSLLYVPVLASILLGFAAILAAWHAPRETFSVLSSNPFWGIGVLGGVILITVILTRTFSPKSK